MSQAHMSELMERLQSQAEARSAIERQAAETKSLRQADNWVAQWGDIYEWPTPEQTLEGRAKAELTRLQALVEQLAGALEPFAREADRYDPEEEDGLDEAWASAFLIGDLRRARTTLSTAKGADHAG